MRAAFVSLAVLALLLLAGTAWAYQSVWRSHTEAASACARSPHTTSPGTAFGWFLKYAAGRQQIEKAWNVTDLGIRGRSCARWQGGNIRVPVFRQIVMAGPQKPQWRFLHQSSRFYEFYVQLTSRLDGTYMFLCEVVKHGRYWYVSYFQASTLYGPGASG